MNISKLFNSRKLVNRKVKDSVFTKLFSDPKYAFELYKTIHPEDTSSTESMLDIITLENIFTNGLYNDLGILLENRLMIFVEAQSSWNANMSIRTLFYISQTYEKYIKLKDLDVMSYNSIKIPKPEVYVIFTGERKEKPEFQYLSSHFIDFSENDDKAIEVKVKMIYNYNNDNVVGQYIKFCKIFDEQMHLFPQDKRIAIKRTLEICLEKKVLVDFLKKNESEVNTIMKDFIFNEKLLNKIHIESEKRIAREQGLAEGRAEGREAGLAEGREAGLAEGREAGLAEGREAGLAEGREAGRAEGRAVAEMEISRLNTYIKELEQKIRNLEENGVH